MTVRIDENKCNNCGICEEICPENIFSKVEGKVKILYPMECWYCGSCMMDCPQNAIEVIYPRYMRPVILKSHDLSRSHRKLD